jgi:G3E family GTPase
VAFADRILINKVSLVDAEQLEELRRAIKSINATATCYETNYSKSVLEMLALLKRTS